MTALLSEYLLEKNVVSEENMLKALMEQLKSIPSTAQIVHEKAMLSNKQIIDVLHYSQKNYVEFSRAAQILGYWDMGLAQKIKKNLEELRLPIMEILVKNHGVSLEEMTAAFVGYVEQLQDDSSLPEKKSTTISSTLSFIDGIQELEQNIVPKLKEQLEALEGLSTQTLSPVPFQEKFDELIRYIQKLVEEMQIIFKQIGAKQSYSIVSGMIVFLKASTQTNIPIEIQSIFQFLNSSLKIVDNVLVYLKNFRTEGALPESGE